MVVIGADRSWESLLDATATKLFTEGLERQPLLFSQRSDRERYLVSWQAARGEKFRGEERFNFGCGDSVASIDGPPRSPLKRSEGFIVAGGSERRHWLDPALTPSSALAAACDRRRPPRRFEQLIMPFELRTAFSRTNFTQLLMFEGEQPAAAVRLEHDDVAMIRTRLLKAMRSG